MPTLFISDLHLDAERPHVTARFLRFLREDARGADALYILGDLFEAWVGDDAAREPGFEADCAGILRATAQRLPVFFLAGNRDFLVGADFARDTGVTLLADPTVLDFGARRWMLTHGDALCLADTDYLAFRAQVRTPAWQQGFLALPLAQRRAIARGLRAESEDLKRQDRTYADVDTAAALQWLASAGASTLVHGHTHRPFRHALDAVHDRIVLSDWDAAATPPRLEALRIDAGGGAQRIGLV